MTVEDADESLEVVAQILEDLANRVRQGVVTTFTTSWKGGRACKIETTVDLDAIARVANETETEGDQEDEHGSN